MCRVRRGDPYRRTAEKAPFFWKLLRDSRPSSLVGHPAAQHCHARQHTRSAESQADERNQPGFRERNAARDRRFVAVVDDADQPVSSSLHVPAQLHAVRAAISALEADHRVAAFAVGAGLVADDLCPRPDAVAEQSKVGDRLSRPTSRNGPLTTRMNTPLQNRLPRTPVTLSPSLHDRCAPDESGHLECARSAAADKLNCRSDAAIAVHPTGV